MFHGGHLTKDVGSIYGTGAPAGPMAGDSGLPYIFVDNFEAAPLQVAPLTSPRTTTGGQTAVIVDTGNDLSITTNGLENSGGSPAINDPLYRSQDAYARTSGLTLYCKLYIPLNLARDNNDLGFGFHTTTAPGISSLHKWTNYTRAGGFGVAFNVASYIAPWAFNTLYVLAIALRANGAHLLIKGGAYDDWTLGYTTRNSTSTPLYIVRFNGLSSQMPDHTRFLGLAQLAESWVDDSFYLHSDDTPTADDTATASANGAQYIDWIVGAGETLAVYFRRTDDNNTMVLRCSQAGSTMKIVEVDGGGESELSSTAQTFNAGTQYRIGIRYASDTVKTWVNDGVVKNNISGATYNQTVTGIKVAGFASAQYWQAWPYSLVDPTLAEITRWAPSLT